MDDTEQINGREGETATLLGDSPRIIFLHYYGRGTAEKLAQGFRAALNELGKGTAHLH